MDNVQAIQTLTGIILSLVLPFVAEYLNRLWKLDGPKALALAGILAGLISLLVLYLTGQITNTTLTTLTPQNFIIFFTGVYSVSQTTFQLIKKQMHWDEPVG